MIPTVIRGHLARPGSPAEAHLLAWDALAWEAPSPDRLRAELEATHALQRERLQSPDPGVRARYSRGWGRDEYEARVRGDERFLAAAESRAIEAAACLLRALEAEGYLGEDPIHFGSTADPADMSGLS